MEKGKVIYDYIEQIQDEAKMDLCEKTIYYLIKKKHIPEKLRRNYLIGKLYDSYLQKHGGKRVEAVYDISFDFGIDESTVYRILKGKRVLLKNVSITDFA